MREIGRGLLLPQQPDAVACLIRYVLTRPTVLTFRYIDDIPTLTAWAGRGLTGWLSLRRALSAFEKSLPEEITRSDREPPSLPECARDEKQAGKKKNRKKKKPRRGQQPEAPEDSAGAQETEKEETEE